MRWGVILSMILEYVRYGVGCDIVNDISVRQVWGGVMTSMILEYIKDWVGCDNVNDT